MKNFGNSSFWRRVRGRIAIAIVSALLLALTFHLFAFGSWEGFHSGVDHNRDPFADFIGPYYTQVLTLRDGGSLSEGYLYPPALALFMLPLAEVGPVAAFWIWLVVLVIASTALFWVGLSWMKNPSSGLAFAYSLVFGLSFPWLHDLHWGQVSTIVWALSLFGLRAWSLGQNRRAALALSLAVSIKIFPVCLLLPLVLGKDRKCLMQVAGFCGLWLVALPLLMLGLDSTWHFYGALGDRLATKSGEHLFSGEFWGPRMSQFAPAVLSRAWGGAQGIWLVLAWVLPLFTLGLILKAVHRRLQFGDRATAVILVVCATPLWLSPSWIHYFVWLPCAQFYMWRHCGSRTARCVLMASMLLGSTPFFFLAGGHPGYGMGGFLVLAALAVPLASVIESETLPNATSPKSRVSAQGSPA